MKRIIYILIVCFIFASCSNNTKKNQLSIDFTSYTTIKLNPEKNKMIQVNELFEKISLINLETTDRSLLSDIPKIEIDEDRFFIQNNYKNDKFVYSFDFQGKFLGQIGTKGQGPEEMLFPASFALDKKNKEIWLVDNNNNKINKYDYKGEYKGNITNTLSFNNFYISETGFIYYYFSKSKNYKNGNKDELICNEVCIENMFSKSLNFYFPYDCETFPNGEPYFSSKTPFSCLDNAVTFHYIYSDTIYSIRGDTIERKYLIDFGDKKINEDLSALPFRKIFEIFSTEKDKAGLVDNVIETEEFLIFGYVMNEKKHFAFYSKKTQKCIEGLFPDFFNNITFLTTLNNDLIGYCNHVDIDKNLVIRTLNLSQDDINMFNSIKAEDNPFLIKFSLKEFIN
jgi:hypothetical protein